MIQEIIAPIKNINDAKKNKNTTNQILTLIISSLLFAIATVIIATQINMQFQLLLFAATALISFFLSMIVLSAIYCVVLKILTKQGKFYDSLTATTQSILIFSLGLLVTATLILIPEIGFLLGTLSLFLTMVISIAIFFRAITTMVGTDNLHVLLTALIILVAMTLAFQIIVSIQILSELPQINDLMSQTTNFALEQN